MGSLIRTIAIFLVAAGGYSVQAGNPQHFWEPDLPPDQSFLALWRSIKTFALSRYDIGHEGELYPTTELTVQLTHGIVCFFYIGPSRGKSEPLTLAEIAEGKFAEGNRLERSVPGREPPDALTIRGPDPLRNVRFGMTSEKEVENLYRELEEKFKKDFPW